MTTGFSDLLNSHWRILHTIVQPVIDKLENDFGSFTVEELEYEGRQARMLFSGTLHSAQSGIPLDGNPRMLFDYNQLLLEVAEQLSPKRILVLGGGTMTLPTALSRALPRANIRVVEINKGLILLARKHFGFKPSVRLRVTVDDAAHFVQHKVTKKYDLIIVDIYNDFTTPEQFMKLRFASTLKRLLSPGGVLASNCISSLTGDRSMPLRKTAYSYSSEIGPLKVIKVDRNYPEPTPQNLLLLSSPEPKKLEPLLSGCAVVNPGPFIK